MALEQRGKGEKEKEMKEREREFVKRLKLIHSKVCNINMFINFRNNRRLKAKKIYKLV